MKKKSAPRRKGRVTKSYPKLVHPTLSKEQIEEFKRFIEYHPAERFSKNLRKMLIEFLMYDGALEAVYLKDLLWDLEGLFMLLDILESKDCVHRKSNR